MYIGSKNPRKVIKKTPQRNRITLQTRKDTKKKEEKLVVEESSNTPGNGHVVIRNYVSWNGSKREREREVARS